MGIDIARCDGDKLGTLGAELDREFVSRRGRRGTLSDRYPLAFEAEPRSRFLVLRRDGTPLACLAARSFPWHTPTRDWRGVMIGLVYTAPGARGDGLGSRLLRAALGELAAAGHDFAVLWSRLDGFYEACGFRRADPGLFGRLALDGGPDEAVAGVPVRILPREHLVALERLRRRCQPAATARPSAAWRTLPLPAESVHVHRAGPPTAPSAYLLFGINGRTRIVYELLGETTDFGGLWQAITADAAEVLVNDVADSTSTRWITANLPLLWQPQNLALWAPLTPAARKVDFSPWYIPYFDRL